VDSQESVHDAIEWFCGTLVDLQLDAQNSYLFTYNIFIKILNKQDRDTNIKRILINVLYVNK